MGTEKGSGVGLKLMQHRLTVIGGRLTMEAVPGRGTEIVCVAPVARP
jgi:signal transduction histidine kinase